MSNGLREAPLHGAPVAGADVSADSRHAYADASGRMGVVVVNYGSSNLVAANLGALDLESDTTDVILVDNFSSADETDRARALARARGWHFVAMPTNAGFGAGVNAGIREADRHGCTCFLLLNPDAVVSPHVIAELRAHSLREPLALITPRLESSHHEPEFVGSRLDLRTGDIRGIRSARRPRSAFWRTRASSDTRNPFQEWLPATCLAVHRDLLARVAGFDEPYFLYWEDVDFSYRCVRAGASLIIRHDLVVVHDAGGTQGPQPGPAKSPLYYRYNCRNRLLFAARHLRGRQLWGWILYTPAESWQILLRGGRRQLLRSPAPLLAAIRGSIEGLCLAAAALVGPRLTRGGRHPRVVSDRLTEGAGAVTAEERAVSSVTVAMATYQRPDDVAEVLPLLVEQARSVMDRCGIHVDVLVVDNDPAQSARQVVAEHAGVRYVAEPEPGISAARNRALTESVNADLLVFIDDDERPKEKWLSALIHTHAETGAGAVAGPVVTILTGEHDPWLEAGGFFARRHRAGMATGTEIKVAATNNLLLDLRQIRAMGLRFDADFGLSGGGDSMFTSSFSALGGRIVWCSEAVVTEEVRESRLNRGWMIRRALSYGTTDTRIRLKLAGTQRGRAVARAQGWLRGLPRVLVGSCRYVLGLAVRSNRHQALGMSTLARGSGMILGSVGYAYHRYKRAR